MGGVGGGGGANVCVLGVGRKRVCVCVGVIFCVRSSETLCVFITLSSVVVVIKQTCLQLLCSAVCDVCKFTENNSEY